VWPAYLLLPSIFPKTGIYNYRQICPNSFSFRSVTFSNRLRFLPILLQNSSFSLFSGPSCSIFPKATLAILATLLCWHPCFTCIEHSILDKQVFKTFSVSLHNYLIQSFQVCRSLTSLSIFYFTTQVPGKGTPNKQNVILSIYRDLQRWLHDIKLNGPAPKIEATITSAVSHLSIALDIKLTTYSCCGWTAKFLCDCNHSVIRCSAWPWNSLRVAAH